MAHRLALILPCWWPFRYRRKIGRSKPAPGCGSSIRCASSTSSRSRPPPRTPRGPTGMASGRAGPLASRCSPSLGGGTESALFGHVTWRRRWLHGGEGNFTHLGVGTGPTVWHYLYPYETSEPSWGYLVPVACGGAHHAPHPGRAGAARRRHLHASPAHTDHRAARRDGRLVALKTRACGMLRLIHPPVALLDAPDAIAGREGEGPSRPFTRSPSGVPRSTSSVLRMSTSASRGRGSWCIKWARTQHGRPFRSP